MYQPLKGSKPASQKDLTELAACQVNTLSALITPLHPDYMQEENFQLNSKKKIDAKLDERESQGIITQVTEPTHGCPV